MELSQPDLAPHILARFTPTEDSAYCHESNVNSIIGVSGAFLVLALISVVLRICVRTRMVKMIGWDDYMMIAAAAMGIGTFVCFVGEAYDGLGRHEKCMALLDLDNLLEWQFFHGILILLGVVFVKISIAFFLMRIVPNDHWKRFLWVAVGEFTCHIEPRRSS
jgi:hypothetical protein